MKQLDPLTGLRGIAAYSVLIGHAISCSCHYGNFSPMQPFETKIAYFGMSLFFVLSGFVIQYNYTNLFRNHGLMNGGYKFFVSRFARLFPLYAMVMIFNLDKIPSATFHHKPAAELAYITLTQSWFDLQTTFFAPAWSISTECFFYLFFLVAFPFFDRIKKPTFFLTIFALLTFLFLPNLLGWEMAGVFSGHNLWVTYFSPFTRVFEFIAGMFAAKIYVSSCEKNKELNVWVKIAFILCVAWLLLVISWDPLKHTKYAALMPSFMFAPALAPLLYLCCRYELKINKLLCSRYVLFMGEISYSVYLLGFLIMNSLIGTYVWHKPCTMAYINSFIKITGIISLTTLIAYGSYCLVEVPCRNFIRRVFLFDKRRKMSQPSLDGVVVETNQ